MNTTSETHPGQGLFYETSAGSTLSVPERLGAVGTIILAILGLAGIYSNIVACVAAIVIGGVFLTEGMMASAAVRHLHSHASGRQTVELGSGMHAGFFAGLAGIVLGILSFFRANPNPLLAVAVLVFGTALLLGGGGAWRLISMVQSPGEETQTSVSTGSGGLFLGLATIVLGILALIGLVPMTLVLVGLLCLGAGGLFSGPSLATTTP
jgi:hypothetical protein